MLLPVRLLGSRVILIFIAAVLMHINGVNVHILDLLLVYEKERINF